MSDLIKREDVLEAIWDWCCNREYAYTNATYWLQKRIESIPSAERKGEWIKRYGTINCSVCKRSNWSLCFEDTVRSFNYCPNCGARMKGAEDEML